MGNKPQTREWDADEYFLEALHPSWHRDAACRDSIHLFFAPDDEHREERLDREARAKGICNKCPVQVECRQVSLERKELHGVWGGLTEDERKVSQRHYRKELALARG